MKTEKQKVIVERIQKSLLSDLLENSPYEDKLDFLQILQNWLKENAYQLGASFAFYNLNYFKEVLLTQLPVDKAELSPEEEINSLKINCSSTLDEFCMTIRDIFWWGTILGTERMCPSCGNDYLQILQERDSAKLVYYCNICSWTEDEQNVPAANDRMLEPATIANLAKHKI